MKHALTVITLVLAANFASARIICSIQTGESPDKPFERSIFSEDVSSSRLIWVTEDDQGAKALPLNSASDPTRLARVLDGQMLVNFNAQANGEYAIAVGRMNYSKMDPSKSEKGPFVTDSIAVGSVTEQNPLLLSLPQKKLSFICFLHN